MSTNVATSTVANATPGMPALSAPAPSVQAFGARELCERVEAGAQAAVRLARQYRSLDTLRRAASQLVVERPLPELFELLLDLLFEAVPAERAAVLLREGRSPELVLKASRSRSGSPCGPVSRSLATRVLDDRVTLLVADALEEPDLRDAGSILAARVRSALCAPLWLRTAESEEVVGLVYLDNPRRRGAFDEQDAALVTAIANVAAVKLQNARLLAESLEGRRLQEEMRLAAQVQACLLPAAPPRMAGWSLAGLALPSHAMGGDYFDWELGADGLKLALADVSGKGAAAAMLMAVVRALVRTAWSDPDLASAARRVDRATWEGVPRGRYATGLLARLDTRSGRLAFVNAGHPPALVVRRAGGCEALSTGGLPFGLVEEADYAAGEAWLRPGDTLLVFSDGVLETRSRAGEDFGHERLAAIARATRGLDAGATLVALRYALEAFADGAPAEDDRTLLVLKRAA